MALHTELLLQVLQYIDGVVDVVKFSLTSTTNWLELVIKPSSVVLAFWRQIITKFYENKYINLKLSESGQYQPLEVIQSCLECSRAEVNLRNVRYRFEWLFGPNFNLSKQGRYWPTLIYATASGQLPQNNIFMTTSTSRALVSINLFARSSASHQLITANIVVR